MTHSSASPLGSRKVAVQIPWPVAVVVRPSAASPVGQEVLVFSNSRDALFSSGSGARCDVFELLGDGDETSPDGPFRLGRAIELKERDPETGELRPYGCQVALHRASYCSTSKCVYFIEGGHVAGLALHIGTLELAACVTAGATLSTACWVPATCYAGRSHAHTRAPVRWLQATSRIPLSVVVKPCATLLSRWTMQGPCCPVARRLSPPRHTFLCVVPAPPRRFPDAGRALMSLDADNVVRLVAGHRQVGPTTRTVSPLRTRHLRSSRHDLTVRCTRHSTCCSRRPRHPGASSLVPGHLLLDPPREHCDCVDGPGPSARFRLPHAVAADGCGALFVADCGAVRRVELPGADAPPGAEAVVSTV